MIEWKEQTLKYQNGHNGFLGKWLVFAIYWDSASMDRDRPWRLTTRLPGLKQDLGRYETIEAAQTKTETALVYWLKSSGLQAKESSNAQ